MGRRAMERDRSLGEASKVASRKDEHLEFFRSPRAPSSSAWFEHVHLIHQALPEVAASEVDLEVEFLGRRFRAPFMITATTGGTEKGLEVLRCLASCASRLGIGLGLGSLRPALEDEEAVNRFWVRDLAKDIFLAGNIGGVQLVRTDFGRLLDVLKRLGVDALCVHLNPTQEMMQKEGDRDFRGVTEAIARAVEELGLPVIVKEVGCGLSREVGLKLRGIGVQYVDVAGSGGTSFVEVEMVRAGLEGSFDFEDMARWGIPTAASLCEVADLGFRVIASGGIRSGLDAAKAFALGATLVGIAGPAVQAFFEGGEARVEEMLSRMIHTLKTVMVSTSAKRVEDLQKLPRVLLGPLAEWVSARGLCLK